MSEMAPEHPPRPTATQLELRRGLIAELLRTVAYRSDVGPDARRVIIEIALALTATPGVDGTCRTCGQPLPTQYRGRPRVYCIEHSSAARVAQWRLYKARTNSEGVRDQ